MKVSFETVKVPRINDINFNNYTHSMDALLSKRNRGEIGFIDIVDQDFSELKNLAKQYRVDFDTLVVLGIGGSSLGGTTISSALSHIADKELIFLDNVDSDYFYETMAKLDLNKTFFNVISKSGSTAETMAQFLYIYGLLKIKFSKEELRKRIVITTSKDKGALRPLVKDFAFNSLVIPDNIGGRFSVLTAVGLFPASFAGLNIDAILDGARKQRDIFLKEREKSSVFKFSVYNHIEYLAGKDEIVLMPYSTKLAKLSLWFVQLWNESLGKHGMGQTAIPAVGTTDQHSQVQLFMEGKNNKLINFIGIDRPNKTIELPYFDIEVEAFSYLSGHTMHELLEAELYSTREALFEKAVSSVMINIESLDENNLGALFMFYELAVAITGEIWGVNTFDQPGVELGKIYTYRKMGRRGY